MPADTTGITPSAPPPLATASARVHVVAPSRFGDAKEIADRLKDSRPVIVNLQMADRDLQRRMIDFCSGVTYALSGEMEKGRGPGLPAAPTGVKISDEESNAWRTAASAGTDPSTLKELVNVFKLLAWLKSRPTSGCS